MRKLTLIIDAISIWTGKAISWLIFFVVIFVLYEILMRYVFHRPTLWVSESMVFGSGLTYVLGAAWALQDNRHVKIDMIYGRLSLRRRAMVDSATFAFFALYLGVFFWATSNFAWRSILVRETASSAWDPPVYPIKTALALGVFLLLLQGIAKFIRDFHLAVTGKKL